MGRLISSREPHSPTGRGAGGRGQARNHLNNAYETLVASQASSPGTIERPAERIDDGTGSGEHWVVTVFNNDHNTYDQVMFILMAATGCDEQEAWMETWEIDNLGKSVVHHGQEKECQEVAGIIATIGIRVEVSAE